MAIILQEAAATEDHKTLKFNLKHGSCNRVFFVYLCQNQEYTLRLYMKLYSQRQTIKRIKVCEKHSTTNFMLSFFNIKIKPIFKKSKFAQFFYIQIL